MTLENLIMQLTEKVDSLQQSHNKLISLTTFNKFDREPESDNISAPEAAKLLNVAVQTVYINNMKGLLPKPRKVGKKLFFSRKEILEFIDNNGKLPESTESGTSQSVPQKPKRRIVSNVKRVSNRKWIIRPM